MANYRTSIISPADLPANIWDWPLQREDGVVTIQNDSNKFEASLQCQYFSPNEIEVKIIGENVVIHCKHEAKSCESAVSREINRTYKLPQDVNVMTLKSHLNNKGILTLTADKRK
uniref:SHSP domain-containing protein n=1 Tax=Parastrongyloides trichosuri TaxID=131310 RepID=A0A0N4Z273_PARTI